MSSEPPAQAPAASRTSRVLAAANELVKAPLFVFDFGASFASLLPAIKDAFTPAAVREAKRAEDAARADAVLVAPFLADLSASEPSRFVASKAALLTLANASRDAKTGTPRPVFDAVIKAIDAVGQQSHPRPESDTSPEFTAKANEAAAAAGPAALPASAADAPDPALSSLQDAIVYIQCGNDDVSKWDAANELMRALHAHLVVAPGVQKMAPATTPKWTQVRYFHDEDEAKAQVLASFVAARLHAPVYAVRPDFAAKPGTLEIWLGRQ